MTSGSSCNSRLMALLRRVCRSLKRHYRERADALVRAAQAELIKQVTAHPADAEGHYRLARFYFEQGRTLAAAAECRTSLTLGGGKPVTDLLARAYVSGDYSGEGIYALPPYVYQRIGGLASRIRERFLNQHLRILDVGGGDGFLSLFLPHCDYALAEPSVNGLLVGHFPPHSFDVVAACHVFEHILPDQRNEFLRQMCSVARRTAILLGPIDTREHVADATGLIYKITGAEWAREHLECGIPSLDVISGFAAERGLACSVSPSGNRMSVYWAVFAEYFAHCSGKTAELHEAWRFANKYLASTRANAAEPNEYMIELQLEGHTTAQ